MSTRLLILLVLVAGGSLFAGPHVFIGFGVPAPVAVYGPPPPVVAYAAPPCPGPGYSWVSGYWYPSGPRYLWRAGYWTRPPYVGARWVAPRYYGRRYYGGYWRR